MGSKKSFYRLPSLVARKIFSRIKALSNININFGISRERARENTLILLPFQRHTLCCGISALVAFKGTGPEAGAIHESSLMDGNHQEEDRLSELISSVLNFNLGACISGGQSIQETYLGGEGALNALLNKVLTLKTTPVFYQLVTSRDQRERIKNQASFLAHELEKEGATTAGRLHEVDPGDAGTVLERLEALKDIQWCLSMEILKNIESMEKLSLNPLSQLEYPEIAILKQINAVLNSIDRLEVRGRDSAGISIMFTFEKGEFDKFRQEAQRAGLGEQFRARTNRPLLVNNCITIHDRLGEMDGIHHVSLAIVYKYAAAIGSLGDNVKFVRTQIKNDQILHLLIRFPSLACTISAHTRWASVGDITQANCHPVDNESTDKAVKKSGIIHVSLNGDIDNYLELKKSYESRFDPLHPDVTTDTKIIPLRIEHYLKKGNAIENAFRLALNDFEGSHAVSMHSDLAPGRLFLAQKGSGQAIFIGISPECYVTASELYGIVEETSTFIKLNGEKKGQIVILDQNSPGGTGGMTSMDYEGNPIHISDSHLQQSRITSRDIDRQHFPHYFLKEISESPLSVEKTLLNRWRPSARNGLNIVNLDESVIPGNIRLGIQNRTIQRIFFIGQGTAGVAAQGCAAIFTLYLQGARHLDIRAMKSSELSGFSMVGSESSPHAMDDHLVVAISQSGTTTDTNRAIDMIKARGAKTIAIVNRRDSDITFKTDGVLYTSTGRDIEMSVASTKAFYSQITAGALLGLQVAELAGTLSPEDIDRELQELFQLPSKMVKVLGMKDSIKASAMKHAVTKSSWATVGSGFNKTSADEIRIKLSELCYKTISSDFVEDKKHIDLSSEPLVIVCAAGTRESVLKDIVKDTAIFHAHKATPLVITDQGEERFNGYAADIFRVPMVSEQFAPVLNTLVGHLWGYYAALSIHESSGFMFRFHQEITDMITEYKNMGLDIYEVVLENAFREKIAAFYNEFTKRRRQNRFPDVLGIGTATNLTLLLKYLSGRLPVADFEIDFGKKGTPANMLDQFFETLSDAVNAMARPVDAIKHQAKTVTVGTSRIDDQEGVVDLRDKFQGVVFDEIASHGIDLSRITNRNVLVVKNLQEVISHVNGSLLYRISGLNLLGEPTTETRMDVIRKTGTLAGEHSRVETEHRLQGTKNIIVREGNVYIGKGRKDGRSILVIPVISSSPDSSVIENLLSINVAFKREEQVSLLSKIKALGGKFVRIKDIILETDHVEWDDSLLDTVPIRDLFGDSAEKIADT
ncbi:MAG: SIS domain-containing protein, partial [Desulfamplus sp.]|nr:SIS domain-containing protein [Desulfamplus sp.]